MLNFDELNILINASIIVNDDVAGFLKDVRNWLSGAFLKGIDEMDEEFEYFFSMEPDVFLDKEILGKTYEDRVREHWQANDPEAIRRVILTESERMYNTGRDEVAKSYSNYKGIELYKTWVTVGDDKVRDTHFYLDGDTIPLREKFYTYDGDSADFPGDFSNADNNVNCRCSLVYSQGRL